MPQFILGSTTFGLDKFELCFVDSQSLRQCVTSSFVFANASVSSPMRQSLLGTRHAWYLLDLALPCQALLLTRDGPWPIVLRFLGRRRGEKGFVGKSQRHMLRDIMGKNIERVRKQKLYCELYCTANCQHLRYVYHQQLHPGLNSNATTAHKCVGHIIAHTPKATRAHFS